MKNTATVLAHLNLPQYDAIRDLIRAQTLRQAEREAQEWFAAVEAFDISRNDTQWKFPVHAPRFLTTPESVTNGPYHARHERTKAAVVARACVINTAAVQKAADQEWADTKAFYAARVGEKIDALLEGEASIECKLTLDLCLLGTVTATRGEKQLVLATNLKTNYRYGVFAADRRLTVYWQVPTIVRSYSGFDLPAREAELVRESLRAKEDRKAEMKKLQDHIALLEKQKRCWDDIHHSLDYAAKYEKAQPLHQRHIDEINQKLAKLSLPPMVIGELTAKSAYAKIKELRVAIKTAKLTLREVRQPNSMEAVS